MVPVSYLDNGAVKKYLLGDKGRVYGEKLEGEEREVVGVWGGTSGNRRVVRG
jgi:hypothetical protein